MLSLIKKVIKDCLTGIDGETYDPARVAGLFGIIVFLGLAVYAVVVKNQAWDPQSFGLGFGGLVTGVGAGVLLKKSTEPKQDA